MRYLKIFRWKESLFFCWFTLMGFLFVKDYVFNNIVNLCVVLLSVYLINLWGLLTNDYFEKNIDIKSKEYVFLSVILVFISLFLIFPFGIFPFVFVISISIMFLLYSIPLLYFKSNLIVSQLIHLFSGVLYFLIPIFVFNLYSLYFLKVGIILSLAFVGGHINHEIRDYEEDLLLGYKTLPIVIGKKGSFIIAGIIFSFLFFIMSFLVNKLYIKIIFYCIFVIHLIAFIYVYNNLESKKRVSVYQLIYRILFSIGIIFIAMFSQNANYWLQ